MYVHTTTTICDTVRPHNWLHRSLIDINTVVSLSIISLLIKQIGTNYIIYNVLVAEGESSELYGTCMLVAVVESIPIRA